VLYYNLLCIVCAHAVGVELSPDADTTLEDLLMHDLSPHQEAVDRVSESAAKEYQIEAALDKVLLLIYYCDLLIVLHCTSASAIA
jgi:hypothetical protein